MLRRKIFLSVYIAMMALCVVSCSSSGSSSAGGLAAGGLGASSGNTLGFYAQSWYASRGALLSDDSVTIFTVQAVGSQGVLSPVSFSCSSIPSTYPPVINCTSTIVLPDGLYLITSNSAQSNPLQAHLLALGAGHTVAGSQQEPIRITSYDTDLSTHILGLMNNSAYNFQTAWVSKNAQYANPLRLVYQDYYYSSLGQASGKTTLESYLSAHPTVFYEFVPAPTAAQLQCNQIPFDFPLGVSEVVVKSSLSYLNSFPGDTINFSIGGNQLVDFLGSSVSCAIPDCSGATGWSIGLKSASCQPCPANYIGENNSCQPCGPGSDRQVNNFCRCGGNAACSQPLRCSTSGTCVQCLSNQDCATGNYCVSGSCVECVSNYDCLGQGLSCVSNQCVQCTKNSDCGGVGDTCSSGSCICAVDPNQGSCSLGQSCSSTGCGENCSNALPDPTPGVSGSLSNLPGVCTLNFACGNNGQNNYCCGPNSPNCPPAPSN